MEPNSELGHQLDRGAAADSSLSGEPKILGDGGRATPQSQFGALSGQSELFSLRVWREVLGNGQIEWRGRVQRVLSGESYYFRSWPMLIDRLSEMLPTEMPSERLPDSGHCEEAMQAEK